MGLPELLQEVDGVAALEVEEGYRWMHPTTHRISAAATQYRDVGGCLCCWDRVGGAADATDDADAAAVAATLVGAAEDQQALVAEAQPERLERGITDSVKRINMAVLRRQARRNERAARAALHDDDFDDDDVEIAMGYRNPQAHDDDDVGIAMVSEYRNTQGAVLL
jgi:hypothetical protein